LGRIKDLPLPNPYLGYILDGMTVTQTLDIPADRRITLEVPREIPIGRTIIAFTPASETENPKYNAKAMAAIEEGKAIMRGDIKVKWNKPHELEEVWKDILNESSDN